MKKLTIVVVLLLLVSAVTITLACVKKKPHGFEDRLGGMIEKISSSLNLTEEQKKKAVEIKNEILIKNKDLRESGKSKDLEIEEAFSKQIKSAEFDDKALNKLLDKKTADMEEMRRFMISELKKFHAVLTPEQRVKLSGILKEMGPKHNSRPEPEQKKEAGK